MDAILRVHKILRVIYSSISEYVVHSIISVLLISTIDPYLQVLSKRDSKVFDVLLGTKNIIYFSVLTKENIEFRKFYSSAKFTLTCKFKCNISLLKNFSEKFSPLKIFSVNTFQLNNFSAKFCDVRKCLHFVQNLLFELNRIKKTLCFLV